MSERRAVGLLAAQAFVFGLSESLLLIAANAIFLAAYGSKWLPLTYVGIAVFGTLLAAWIARIVRRRPLPFVAIVTEAAVALLFLGAWALLTASNGAWVSGPLLVLFPILLQVGFIFVGGQAGRLLDLQQMKARFPRIVSGFAIGFLAGGLVGVPLLKVVGTQDLLLLAAGAQAAFVALLAATARSFADRLGHVDAPPLGLPRPPLHRLLSARFVVLLMAYQVLSAAGTYLVEYILFDRAAARYTGADDLAQFLSRYTIALNVIDILFLAFLAGPLLRRFGLRFGIAANPAVVMLLAVAMLVSALQAGAGSFGLFVLVAAARIADISLTDGTTRTSINTAFQVLPVEERLAVQSLVEGVGLPIAIGATGVLLFALRAGGAPVSVIVAVTVAVCVAWTASALLLYGDYARALIAALRRRLLPEAAVDVEEAETAEYLHELLASDDGRDVRLALDLLPGAGNEVEQGELARLADDPRPEIRLHALTRLAEGGGGRTRLHETLRELLRAPDPAVRVEALEAVGPADGELVGEVAAALDDPATVGAALGALSRLGDAALPLVADALAAAAEPVPLSTLRLVRAARDASPEGAAACLGPFVEHPDRELGLVVLSALGEAGVDPAPLAGQLDRTLRADAEHAARCDGVLEAVEPGSAVARAVRDELDLLRDRTLAVLAVRYGADRIHAVALGLGSGGDGRRSLATETLEVTLTKADLALALPLLEPRSPAAAATPKACQAALDDLVADADGQWRSAWLRECAVHDRALL